MRDRPAFSRKITGKKNNNSRPPPHDDKKIGPVRSKVIIRKLPRALTKEDELSAALGEEWLAKIDWIRLIPGSEGKAFMGDGRAYVRLKDSEDLYSFRQYVEKSDHEYFRGSTVSFAPCQRVRSGVGKPNPLEGTLEDFEDFKVFCAQLRDGLPHVQEEVKTSDKQESKEGESTALMAFLEKQHQGKQKKKKKLAPPPGIPLQKGGQQKGSYDTLQEQKKGTKDTTKATRGKKKATASGGKKKSGPPAVPKVLLAAEETKHGSGTNQEHTKGSNLSNARSKKNNTPKPSHGRAEATRGGRSTRGRGRGNARVVFSKKNPADAAP